MLRLGRWFGLLAAAVAASGCSREPPVDPPDPAASVERAIAYLTDRRERLSPMIPLLQNYLSRKFEVEALSYASLGPGNVSDLTGRKFWQFEAFQRLVDAEASVDRSLIEGLAFRNDRLSTMALHCDRLPLPLSFPSHVEEAIRDGRYRLTHAVMAVQWALENGCVKAADVESIHADQVAGLVSLIEQEGVVSDLGLEGIAMLYYSGERDRVTSDWIGRVVSSQHADGGWAGKPGGARSRDHATGLGIWVLLEHLHPEAPEIPMIPSG